MRLLAVGMSHRTAPVELRECADLKPVVAVFALDHEQRRRAGRRQAGSGHLLGRGVPGFVVGRVNSRGGSRECEQEDRSN